MIDSVYSFLSYSIFSWLWLTPTPALCPKLKVSTFSIYLSVMLLIVSNRFCEYASLLFILSALPSIFSPFTILLYAALDRWFRFSLLRALELFDMLLPSHLARRATCYLGDSNIHFCPGSRCLPLLLCVPPHCFSNSLTYVARAAPILLPTPLPLSFSRLFVLSLSLLSTLSLPLHLLRVTQAA